MQKKLLTENDLTLEKALDVAQNKMASVCAKQLQSPITARDQEKYVYKVTSAHSQRLQRVRRLLGNTCYCCGKPDHKKDQCKYKDYTCNNCGQTGHLRYVCSKPPMKKPTNTSKRKAGDKGVQVVTQDNPAADKGDIDTILHVGPIFNKPLEVQLDGKLFTMELDTGAAMFLCLRQPTEVCLVKRLLSSPRSSCTHTLGSR